MLYHLSQTSLNASESANKIIAITIFLLNANLRKEKNIIWRMEESLKKVFKIKNLYCEKYIDIVIKKEIMSMLEVI